MSDYLPKPLEYLVKTLEYYFEDGSHVVFEKYTIDTLAVIRNVKTGKTPSYGSGTYNLCSVIDAYGKRRNIRVARAVASTFLGKPPTLAHTADHEESEEKKNDALTNVRWLDQSGQKNNRNMPDTLKTAFFVVKDGVEKTLREWVDHMNVVKKQEEREYTYDMIKYYAQKKQHGFAYKEYLDLEGEIWKSIKGSKNKKGCWEISNMKRVKYVTKYVSNVLWGDRLGRDNGYPAININGKTWRCHILAFLTFREDLWKFKKDDENVLHEDDDQEDFRPHKLYLGTQSVNAKDAYDNGKRDDTKSARVKCASYVGGEHEKDFKSQRDAAKYVKSKGYSKASIISIGGNIGLALTDVRNTAYGRTWKPV